MRLRNVIDDDRSGSQLLGSRLDWFFTSYDEIWIESWRGCCEGRGLASWHNGGSRPKTRAVSRLASTTYVVGAQGFEPRYSESESDVLPLDDAPLPNLCEPTGYL